MDTAKDTCQIKYAQGVDADWVYLIFPITFHHHDGMIEMTDKQVEMVIYAILWTNGFTWGYIYPIIKHVISDWIKKIRPQ